MRLIGTKVMAIVGGLAFAAVALADGMTHAQYEAAEEVIEADHKLAKKHCDALSGRAEDVCEQEAKAARIRAVASAEARAATNAQQ